MYSQAESEATEGFVKFVNVELQKHIIIALLCLSITLPCSTIF